MKRIEIKVKSRMDEHFITIICITDDECIDKATKWLKIVISNT